MNASATFPLRVAGLTIDPVLRRISGPDGETQVEPLVMQLFLHLIDRQGEVLQRRELFHHLWGNAQVGDDSLNRLVGGLRKALERTGGGEVQVETVPRLGYRLIVEPSVASVPSTTRRAAYRRRRIFLACARWRGIVACKAQFQRRGRALGGTRRRSAA